MLIWVNPTRDPGLDQWPDICSGSTPELGFKTIIIIIFILTCLRWIILELKVFYKDILWMKNNKYCFWRLVIFVTHVLKNNKFTLKLSRRQIYFYVFIFVSSTKHISVSIIFVFFNPKIILIIFVTHVLKVHKFISKLF
jgi:hypothetical protein